MNRKKIKSKRLSVTIAALFCALTLSVPPISAYYESTASVKNTTIIGDVSVQMIDKLADPVQGITPLKEYKRCPYVQNAGVNDVYVFIIASIPYRSAILAESDGMNDGDKVNTELFSINATADWMLLDVQKNTTKQTMDYIYSYTNGSDVLTKLDAGASTSQLCSTLKVNNVANYYDFSGETFAVDFKAYGIQTSYLGGERESSDSPDIVWDIVAAQNGLTSNTKAFALKNAYSQRDASVTPNLTFAQFYKLCSTYKITDYKSWTMYQDGSDLVLVCTKDLTAPKWRESDGRLFSFSVQIPEGNLGYVYRFSDEGIVTTNTISFSSGTANVGYKVIDWSAKYDCDDDTLLDWLYSETALNGLLTNGLTGYAKERMKYYLAGSEYVTILHNGFGNVVIMFSQNAIGGTVDGGYTITDWYVGDVFGTGGQSGQWEHYQNTKYFGENYKGCYKIPHAD